MFGTKHMDRFEEYFSIPKMMLFGLYYTDGLPLFLDMLLVLMRSF